MRVNLSPPSADLLLKRHRSPPSSRFRCSLPPAATARHHCFSSLSTLTISSSHYHQRSGPPPKAFNRLICKMGLIILIASIFLCVIRRQSNVFMHASCSVKCLDDYCLAVLSVG